MNGSMNTKIHYLYRDADNYKVHNSCVIKGVLTPAQIDIRKMCRNKTKGRKKPLQPSK